MHIWWPLLSNNLGLFQLSTFDLMLSKLHLLMFDLSFKLHLSLCYLFFHFDFTFTYWTNIGPTSKEHDCLMIIYKGLTRSLTCHPFLYSILIWIFKFNHCLPYWNILIITCLSYSIIDYVISKTHLLSNCLMVFYIV